MGSWYYAVRGQTYGPVSDADLRRLALDGHVSPDAMVMPVGGTAWQPIASIEWQLGLVRTEWNRYIPAPPPAARPVAGGFAPPPPPPPPPPPGFGAPLGYGLPGTTAPVAPGGQPFASYGRRVLAYLLDSLITGVLGLALIWPAGGLEVDDRSGGGFSFEVNTVGVLISLLIGVLYFGGLHGTARGQTVGKMALGIRVVDLDAGTPIGFGRATVRYLITVLFSVLCVVPWIVDHLWPLWDPQRQALHDKVVRSAVVTA